MAGDPALPNLQGARPIHLSSHESFRDLPMMTPEQAKQAHKYIVCSHLSQGGDEQRSMQQMKRSGLDDAFQCTHQDRELVPGSIRSSTVRQEGRPTQLIDSSTGLAASIHFDPASREVIVGFSGISFAGSRFGCGLNQMLSCAAQWLGLVPKNMRQSSRIVELMKEHTAMKVQINGHTDNVGSAEYNYKLSLQRAEAVRDYLVANGAIAAERISVKGFGFKKPVASNKSEEGRHQNRRSEFTILTL